MSPVRRLRYRLSAAQRAMVYVALAVAAALFALRAFVRITGDPDPHLAIAADQNAPPDIGDPLFERMLELYGRTQLEPGNQVQQLLNGDGTNPALWRDLAQARRTITVQMYFANAGAMSDSLARILADRVRAGVRVLMVLDAFGAIGIPPEWIQARRHDGISIVRLRRLRWFTVQSAANRSHVRAVVIDGRIGYTGGFGLADYWSGDGRSRGAWRETNVRFTGSAVLALQAAFAAAWAEATGALLSGDAFFPDDSSRADAGGMRAGLLFTEPATGNTSAERFLGLVVSGARHRLYIANSYFVPNAAFRELLVRAARRGVDVRVLTTGNFTDVRTALYAGRHYYDQLLPYGVRIYEYQPSMMHAKTIVADGLLGTIGSMNFTNRSLAFNNEANLVVLDRAFAATMEATFNEDLRFAREVSMTDVQHRPLWQRALQLGAAMITRLL